MQVYHKNKLKVWILFLNYLVSIDRHNFRVLLVFKHSQSWCAELYPQLPNSCGARKNMFVLVRKKILIEEKNSKFQPPPPPPPQIKWLVPNSVDWFWHFQSLHCIHLFVLLSICPDLVSNSSLTSEWISTKVSQIWCLVYKMIYQHLGFLLCLR